jgi:hypothetical protein
MTWPQSYSAAELTEANLAQELTRICKHEENGRGACLRCGAIKDMQGFWEAPLRRPVHAVLGPAPDLPPELRWRGFVLPRDADGDYELKLAGDWGELLLPARMMVNREPIRPCRRAFARVTIQDDDCDEHPLVSQSSGLVGNLGTAGDLLLALDTAAAPAIAKLTALGALGRRLTGELDP